MSGFSTFLAKEFTEIRKTWRIWVIPGMLLFFAITLHAKDLPVPSTVQWVKVFLTGAEVTRTGKASLRGN